MYTPTPEHVSVGPVRQSKEFCNFRGAPLSGDGKDFPRLEAAGLKVFALVGPPPVAVVP